MSRTADGSGANYIRCAVGGCAAGGTGAYTIISLARLNLFAAVGGMFQLRGAGTQRRQLIVSSAKMFGTGDFSAGFGAVVSDGVTWSWLVERKQAGGTAHYEFAYANYPVVDPNVDIVFGEANDAGNHGDPGAGDEIWIGEADVHWRGAKALDVWFNGYLSNAQIKSALTQSLTDIMALTPAGCWPLNQANIAVPVTDVTGNGADEIETVGTVGIASNPPNYDFTLTTTTDLIIANASQAQSATSIGTLLPPITGNVNGAVTSVPSVVGRVTTSAIALTGTIE